MTFLTRDMVLIWASTNATIPSDFSESTVFVDRYMQGDDQTFTSSSNAGGTTHGHSGGSHTHVGTAHRHNFGSGGQSGGGTFSTSGAATVSALVHGHLTATGNFTTITYQTQSITVTAAEHHPPAVKVIMLSPKLNDVSQMPDDIVCFTNETSLPTNFTKITALNGKFLKGVDTLGDDADLTGFGAETHTHAVSGHSHTQSHLHTQATASNASATVTATTGVGTTILPAAHHGVSLDSKSTTTSTESADTGSASSEPAFIKVLGIQNKTGATVDVSEGVVVGFIAAVSAIPDGWRLCDGTRGTPDMRNKQVKVTTVDGEIGDTGGSATHAHSKDHTHTDAAHNHLSTIVQFLGTNMLSGRQASMPASPTHTHTWTIQTVAATLASATVTMDATDIRYKYRTLVFIKKVGGVTVHVKGGSIKGGSIK